MRKQVLKIFGSTGIALGIGCAALVLLAGAKRGAVEAEAQARQAQFNRQRVASAAYQAQRPPMAVSTIDDLALSDEARDKALHVRIYYPEAQGPFPVIIFSHGAGGSQDVGPALLGYWAQHGYVVIAPTHADSVKLRRESGQSPRMDSILREFGTDANLRVERVEDDKFIIDSLAQLPQLAPELAGKLDTTRVGVGGHSAGAMTAMLLGGTTGDMLANGPGGVETCGLLDERVQCILVLSGQGIQSQWGCYDEQSWDAVQLPMLVMTGSLDESSRTGQTPESRCDPYTYAPPGDKYLMFIEGAAHMSFTGKAAGKEGAGNGSMLNALLGAQGLDSVRDFDQQAIFAYVQQASLGFWDAHLLGSRAAESWLHSNKPEKSSGGQVEYAYK